jgi:hypothetical protein
VGDPVGAAVGVLMGDPVITAMGILWEILFEHWWDCQWLGLLRVSTCNSGSLQWWDSLCWLPVDLVESQ